MVMECEKEGFLNLRDEQEKEVPLYRITPLKYAEENNQDPFLANEKRCGKRRIPKNAPPLIDFLLEAYRGLYYSKFPSRHFSIFANLNDYQERYLKDDASLFQVFLHETAIVSISGTVDFRVSNSELVYDFVKKSLKAEHITGQDAAEDLEEILKFDGKAIDGEYAVFHKILEEQLSVPAGGRTRKQKEALFGVIKKCFYSGSEALEPIFSFWKESELAEKMKFSGRGIGNEVVIQGPVYYVKVEPWK
jgi:hypothetical protein